jgi:hypothetical protein
MPEQLSSFEQQREALAEKLRLREQYEQQIKTLNETGVLEILPETQELGIIGIDGKGYPMPKYEEILTRITREKIELLDKKFQQGFTKLLLVPFGMALEVLIDRYKRELLKHQLEGKLFSHDNQKIELNKENPLVIWSDYENADISGGLVYKPQMFSKYHHGRTKSEILQEGGSWQIVFTEDLPVLPDDNQGKTINGRHQLEARYPPEQYHKFILNLPEYQGEQGFNPETWLVLAMTYLHQKNQVIDDTGSQGRACFMVGSYFYRTEFVPRAYCNSAYHQVSLSRNDPSIGDIRCSTRTCVEI